MSRSRFHRRCIQASTLAGIFCFVAMIPAHAGTVGATAVNPAGAAVGTATVVTVTSTITDTTLIANSVQLQRLNANGQVTAVLGTLHDDGLNGDAVANDKIYSLQTNVYQTSPGPLTYRVSAGFKGSLLLAYSSPLVVNVTGGAIGITIQTPANLLYTNTTPVNVTGTVGNPGASVKINGIAAPITSGQFLATVPLVEGLNTLTAVATNPGGVVSTANVQVTLDTTPPHVTIDSPVTGATTTSSTVTVTGTANDVVVGTVNGLDAQVTVNGIAAQVANRTYTAVNVPLVVGANTIQAVARDRAGNGSTVSASIMRVTQPQAAAIGTTLITNSLSIISGNNQAGTIGKVLSAPLIVSLTNSSGVPVANQPVAFTITGNNGSLSGGGTTAMAVAVNTDSQGRAQVTWMLGQRSGAGVNVVQAASALAIGPVSFTATSTPANASQIVSDSGNNQIGTITQALPFPFVAVMTDSGHNRVPNVPVTFTVIQGGGNLAGTVSQTVTSDSNGRAIAVLTLGSQPGNDNNQVQASFAGNTGLPVTFTGTAKTPGMPANTTISGVVLDNSNKPIQGVTMRLYQTNQASNNNLPMQIGTPVTTNAQGAFLITQAPVGYFKLMADGSTAISSNSYPTIEYDIVTVAGTDNSVGMPIYLVALDTVNKLCVDATHGGTLTLPQSPGFALTVAPGSATFPGGSQTGCISVTPVNPDKVPMAPGFGQQPRFIVTIQPVGTTFNPPAPITIPNVDGLKPRAVTEMYSYDHDLSMFVAIGTGTVSNDGSTIASSPGVGVLKAGWHCGGDPNVPGSGTPVSVKITTPAPVIADKDGTTVTAQGAPIESPPGTYSWRIDPAGSTIAAIDGSSTTASVKVKGLAPGMTTLTVRFTCTSVDSNGVHPYAEASIQVIVAQVVSVVFETIDSPLDANPNTGGGMRIFPEKTSAADAVNRLKVRVKATITPVMAQIPVYFKSFDVDDPTTDAAPVDNNGPLGDDNRGGPGSLSATTMKTDANGAASVEFTVTKQPGDNFRLAAATGNTYLGGVTVDKIDLKDSSGMTLPTDNGKITPMLTVWRRVHVETDGMDVVTGNFASGIVTAISSATKTITVDANLDDTSLNLDSAMPDNGRFENGVLNMGTLAPAIQANGIHRIVLKAALALPFTATKGATSIAGNITDLAVSPGLFGFFASSDLTTSTPVGDLSGGTLTIPSLGIVNAIDSSAGSVIHLTTAIQPAFKAFDDDKIVAAVGVADSSLLVTAFAPAYVLPVYDLANATPVAPFVTNSVPSGTTTTYRFDNIATEADAAFWTVYLLGAFQEEYLNDGDPDSEGITLGVVDNINGIGASVFKESLNEITATGVVNQAATAAHEIGHLFNGLHADLGLMAQSTTRTVITFSDVSLNKIRSIAHP